MARAATQAAPDVDELVEPIRPALEPRKLTVKLATEQWAATTRAIEGLKVIQADAAKFLLANAERTGKRTFGERIAVVQTGGSLVLDQAKAKDRLLEIGDRVEDFMKKTKLGLSLKLL